MRSLIIFGCIAHSLSLGAWCCYIDTLIELHITVGQTDTAGVEEVEKV